MQPKKNRLSHSAATKFQTCGKAYDYHYNQKLRAKFTSSALLFGSAIDAAIGKCLNENEAKAYSTFDALWKYQEINKEREYLPESTKVVYANSEFDKELLFTEDVEDLALKSAPLDPLEKYAEISKKKQQVSWDGLDEADKKYYNFANWLSLRRKGHIMIAGFVKEVKPRIKKVLATQKYIQLTNEVGDRIIGFVDLIAELHDGRVVVFDLKTSSIEYEEDAVLTSAQLALYVHCCYPEYKTRTAGYIVLRKQIAKNRKKTCSVCKYDGSGARHKTCSAEVAGKRCNGEWVEVLDPSVNVQWIVDDIPEIAEDLVLGNLDEINQLIKVGIFSRNLQSCIRPWGRCEFYDKCWKNDDSKLIKMDEESKKKND